MAAGGVLTALANPSGSGGSSPATVPGGSQNTSPLGGSVFNTLAQTSPTVATLPQHLAVPGGGQTVPGGGIVAPQPLFPGSPTSGGGAAGGFNPGAGVIDPNASTSKAGDHTVTGDLQQTYGRGTGTAISNVLGGLGTSTSTALQTMDTAAIDAAQRQQGNMQAQLAAQGVNPNSSTAALMTSDFNAQVNNALSSQAAQIGLNEEGTLLNTLLGTGQAHGGDTSFGKTLTNVLSGSMPLVSAVAGAVNQQGWTGTGGLSSVLDVISGL